MSLAKVDHLVYGAPDLAAAVEDLEHALAVRAEPGGRHPAWGTRNALIGLASDCYLEIIGPDRGPPESGGERPFHLDRLSGQRLVTWAAKATGLAQVVGEARRRGVDLGSVQHGSRHRPDGALLTWSLTDVSADRAGGVVPFLIDWGETPHPAQTLEQRCTLLALRFEHPQPEEAGELLEALGMRTAVGLGPQPAVIATISSPRGIVQLR